jgi:hypothetical protein
MVGLGWAEYWIGIGTLYMAMEACGSVLCYYAS